MVEMYIGILSLQPFCISKFIPKSKVIIKNIKLELFLALKSLKMCTRDISERK